VQETGNTGEGASTGARRTLIQDQEADDTIYGEKEEAADKKQTVGEKKATELEKTNEGLTRTEAKEGEEDSENKRERGNKGQILDTISRRRANCGATFQH
jgi:hypothetical protein